MNKENILSIADYLGCNGEELWSEISRLYKPELIVELIRKYKDAEQSVISEFSSDISSDMKKLRIEIENYKKELL